jgi:hypothetical protein
MEFLARGPIPFPVEALEGTAGESTDILCGVEAAGRLARASPVASLWGLALPTTDTVELVVSKRDLPRVQSEVRRVAEIFELQVVEVEEKRGRLSSRLRVTLMGPPDEIASFRKSFAGTPTRGATLLDSLLDFLLNW